MSYSYLLFPFFLHLFPSLPHTLSLPTSIPLLIFCLSLPSSLFPPSILLILIFIFYSFSPSLSPPSCPPVPPLTPSLPPSIPLSFSPSLPPFPRPSHLPKMMQRRRKEMTWEQIREWVPLSVPPQVGGMDRRKGTLGRGRSKEEKENRDV